MGWGGSNTVSLQRCGKRVCSHDAENHVHDARLADATKDVEQSIVKVGVDVFAIHVLVIINPDGAFKPGREIVVLKQDVDDESDEP